MAVVLQERFREHVAVAEALKASYSSRDDIDRIHSIQQLEDDLAQLCTTREADVLAIVKGNTTAILKSSAFTSFMLAHHEHSLQHLLLK